MNHPVKKMLLIMVLLLPILFTFGSYGLYSWSLTLDGNGGYYLFFTPLSRLYRWNEERGLNRIVEEGRNLFGELKECRFDRFEPQGEDSGLPTSESGELPEPAGALPEELPPEPLYEGDTLDILVIGDSLANSVGKRLDPLMNAYPDMTCRVEGVISSNLIRLDYYDWLAKGPAFVAEDSPDVVLIFLGANTMQSFYLDGAIAPLFSEKWKTIYKERASTLLSSLKVTGIDVYWMHLPPMQKESYHRNITILDGLIDEICREKGVERLSYSELITDENGSYVSDKVVGDKQILIRSDGIHFTLDGASYISDYLIGLLRERYEMPEAVPTPQETAPAE
ncbi:MAG: DUF459 domain-containing protein [Spirochaetales bacterium]|nr:DUF459 domain-containing protein [Spirochaetales bacterium]